MKKFIVLLCFAFITGCSVTPYAPPKEGKTAKIDYVVTNQGTGGFALLIFEGATCTKPKAIVDGKQASIGTSTLVSGVNIPAGKSVRLMPALISNNISVLSTCTLPFEFTPKEGTSYTIEFITSSAGCGVNLKRWENGVLSKEPDFKPLKYKQPFSTSGPYCEQ